VSEQSGPVLGGAALQRCDLAHSIKWGLLAPEVVDADDQ